MDLDNVLVVARRPDTVAKQINDGRFPLFHAESIDELRELSERILSSALNSRIVLVLHPKMQPEQATPLLKVAESDRPLLVVAREQSVSRILRSRFQATRKITDDSELEEFNLERFEDLLENRDFDEAANLERDHAAEIQLVGSTDLPRKDKIAKLLLGDVKDDQL